jgi:hypothetical protein
MRIKDIIAHLFDYHVMARENWTLEQLVYAGGNRGADEQR